jgi:hypothetical protein
MNRDGNFITSSIAKAAAILAVVIFVLPACSVFGRSNRTPMTIKVLSGSATIQRADAVTKVGKEAKLQIGDRIKLSRRGVSQIRLEPGRLFELVGGEVKVKKGDRLQLTSGRLLSSISAPGTVNVGALQINSSVGTFRVDRSLSTRVGVYKGRTELQLGADRLTLPRLRQAVVAEGVLPQREKPLRLSSQDRWDKRFLQSVLDLDDRLANFGRGLEAQLGPGTGVEFFNRVVPGSGDLSFLNDFNSNRRSDVLIGLTVASEAVGNDAAELRPTFQKAFGLWSEGASWGLVSYELGVGQTSLFNRLLQAVGLSGILVGGQGAALFGRAFNIPGLTSVTNSGGNSSSGGGGGPAGTTGGPTPPTPPGGGPLPPPGDLIPPGTVPPGTVPEPVQQVVDQILQAGSGATGQDTGSVGTAVDPVAVSADGVASTLP